MTTEPLADVTLEHEHDGPDWRCRACNPLAAVLRDRMKWRSVHWGNLHDDAYPSLAKAIVGSDWLAERDARIRREALEAGAVEMDRLRDVLVSDPAWGCYDAAARKLRAMAGGDV